MPQSLALVIVHIIFSTRDRAPLLDHPVRHDLHAYLAFRARDVGCECYCLGGVADHVHLAVRLSRTITVAKLVEELKTSSSKWLKTQAPKLKAFMAERVWSVFGWPSRSASVTEIYRGARDTSSKIEFSGRV